MPTIQFQPLLKSVTEQNLHILNLVIRHHDEVIAEHHFAPEQRILLWSVSKTFTSIAVGIAQAEGLLTVTDPLSWYFPVPDGEFWQRMTVRDLLCMGAGQRRDPLSAALDAGLPLDDVESLFFAEPLVDAPGAHFFYNNAATYMLSKLISRQTGVSLNDYLRPRIYEPLGIHDVYWEADRSGISFGCSGLDLNAHEIALFGQLLLNEGVWHGTRLIPAEYIRAASTKQIDNADFDAFFATPDHRSGYGYQIWLNRIPNTYRLDGYLGQYVVVIPDKDAVVAITSDEHQKITHILELVWDFIFEQL
jgi:CubicO group peptidase (beta-lactamase class C family)